MHRRSVVLSLVLVVAISVLLGATWRTPPDTLRDLTPEKAGEWVAQENTTALWHMYRQIAVDYGESTLGQLLDRGDDPIDMIRTSPRLSNSMTRESDSEDQRWNRNVLGLNTPLGLMGIATGQSRDWQRRFGQSVLDHWGEVNPGISLDDPRAPWADF